MVTILAHLVGNRINSVSRYLPPAYNETLMIRVTDHKTRSVDMIVDTTNSQNSRGIFQWRSLYNTYLTILVGNCCSSFFINMKQIRHALHIHLDSRAYATYLNDTEEYMHAEVHTPVNRYHLGMLMSVCARASAINHCSEYCHRVRLSRGTMLASPRPGCSNSMQHSFISCCGNVKPR